ncbi:DMT family transporter [Desulfotalea psychrophila]|uniref:EamA domain-containing protein n=1 Tax=Desulfotalea psychrophila (strain LSv54 / DSM 12343) TaxID=177439 RepID=Q6ARK6_DESPS|nr:DMT family transporter [Desulfotalea psychrophila]CAG35019.1 conserved hypothetical protein [Desulfotalea psychrophila LSv54]
MKLIFNSKYTPVIAIFVAMIIWASSFIALKIAFRSYHPMVVIFGRMLIATLCFMVFYKYVFKGFKYHKGDYKPLLFMAFCEPCLYFIFEAIALKNTSASQAGVITATAPIFILAAASLFLKEKYNLQSWLGALAALAGVCWITLASATSESAPNPIFGNFCEVLAMACATGYTVCLKSLTKRYSPLFLTSTQALMGTFFYLPMLFLPFVEMPTEYVALPSFAIIYLGAVVSLIAYGLYNYALAHMPAAQGASYINLIPIFSVAMAWLFLGETLNLSQGFAAALIIASVWVSQKGMAKAHDEKHSLKNK